MAEYTRFINDAQWKMVEPLLPKLKPNPKGGRPPADNREVLEGILWVLRTGARGAIYQIGIQAHRHAGGA